MYNDIRILFIPHKVARICFFRAPSARNRILLDFSLSVKAATLIFISGCGSAISSAKDGELGFIFKLVKS